MEVGATMGGGRETLADTARQSWSGVSGSGHWEEQQQVVAVDGMQWQRACNG